MKTRVYVSAVFAVSVYVFVVFAEAAPSPSVGFLDNMSRTRIMYGDEADVGQFPHQLSLMVNSGNYHVCGAVLVSADAALTAAHCVIPSKPENYRVRAGQHNQGSPVSEHDITSIDAHDDYNQGPGSFPQDIAVLYMASSADVGNDIIGPINIARGDYDFVGDICSISGWGTTETEAQPSALRYSDIPAIDNDECQTLMNNVSGAQIIDSHICVYNNTASTCSGDDGGPLTCGGAVAGLASWSIWGGGQCLVTHPSVYTRVNSFEAWIDERVPNLP